MRNIGLGERGRHDPDAPSPASCGVTRGGAPGRAVLERRARGRFFLGPGGVGCLLRRGAQKRGAGVSPAPQAAASWASLARTSILLATISYVWTLPLSLL